MDMDRRNARWGHSINEYGERFWSRNTDGRYTVAFYTPKAVMVELAQPQSHCHPSELPPGNDLALPADTPAPGPINPSQSNEENFTAQLRSFANALIRRVPLQKDIMSHAQLVHLQNKDVARRKNMSSYVERVASFLQKADERDRYIHNGRSVQELAEAGLFNQSLEATVGTNPPLLICFACGFEVCGMESDPIERHLSSEESACPFKVGYSHRRKVQEQMENQEREGPLEQNRNDVRLKESPSEGDEMRLTELQKLRDKLLKELEKGRGNQINSKEVEAGEHVVDSTDARSTTGEVTRLNREKETLHIVRGWEEGEIEEPSLKMEDGSLQEEDKPEFQE